MFPQGYQYSIPVTEMGEDSNGILASMTNNEVEVGSSSTEVIASNANRRYLLFVNDSDEVIYLKPGAVALMNTGIRINANGGTYEMTMGAKNVFRGTINAICSSGGKNLLVIEGV